MQKKYLIVLCAVVILAGATLYFYHRYKSEVANAPTVIVKKDSITQTAEAIGYIQPRRSSTVKSEIDGIVTAIDHDEGDFVKQGDALAKIQQKPSPTALASLHQQLDNAIARENSAALDVKRYTYAFQSGLITKNYANYIQAQQTYNTAKIDHTLATQQLALIEKGMTNVSGKTLTNIIKSPTDGYILNRFVDEGDPVLSLSSAQASTPLFSIADMKDLMFVGVIDELDSSKIHAGMPAKITIGALADQTTTGKVDKISLQSEKKNVAQGGISTVTDSPFNVGFKIEISGLDIPKNITLRSGYSATAKIDINTVKNILVLPLRVVHFKPDGSSYVLLPAKDKKEPKQQTVKVGVSDNVNIEIKEGLKEGDGVLDQPTVASNSDDD